MVRFAHEMNGGWYIWSQRPLLYIQKFCLVATILHKVLRQLAMLWAPNNGSGYPFLGGNYSCRARAHGADFDILDTNGDGALDMYDDMYAPYYPGDDAVDWVGMTLFWWGATYPFGRNDRAEPWAFNNRVSACVPVCVLASMRACVSACLQVFLFLFVRSRAQTSRRPPPASRRPVPAAHLLLLAFWRLPPATPGGPQHAVRYSLGQSISVESHFTTWHLPLIGDDMRIARHVLCLQTAFCRSLGETPAACNLLPSITCHMSLGRAALGKAPRASPVCCIGWRGQLKDWVTTEAALGVD
eukprot:jgi/Mesen1/1682/ME000137S00597